jgi:catalase-peroxidase
MAMNDEETVALIAGGHTFGKAHGAGRPVTSVPDRKRRASKNRAWAGRTAYGTGKGATPSPAVSKAPGRARRRGGRTCTFEPVRVRLGTGEEPGGREAVGTPKGGAGDGTVPDAHDPSKSHAPMMFTTDLALKMDPIYGPISKRFFENPDQFKDAFAKAGSS